ILSLNSSCTPGSGHTPASSGAVREGGFAAPVGCDSMALIGWPRTHGMMDALGHASVEERPMSRRWSPPEFRPRVSQLRLAVAAFALVQFIAAWANPVPEREWSRMLSLPGQYLRTPSDSTRRALVWTLSQGYLDVYRRAPIPSHSWCAISSHSCPCSLRRRRRPLVRTISCRP